MYRRNIYIYINAFQHCTKQSLICVLNRTMGQIQTCVVLEQYAVGVKYFCKTSIKIKCATFVNTHSPIIMFIIRMITQVNRVFLYIFVYVSINDVLHLYI